MFRRLAALSALLLAACGSTSKKEGASDRPRLPAPLASELPDGELYVTSRESSFMEMLEELEETDVVYIGETSANPDHHLLQLKVIEHLAYRGRLHAIGMEMFQRPFQPALDDYVYGRIDEAEMLARTECAQRWPYPFELYRPVLALARKNRISVRALSVEDEVREPMRKGGRDAVPEALRLTLPAIDTTLYPAHRAHLRATHASETDFDRFYLVRCLEEEVMADGVVTWFRTAPDDGQIVVLAGVDRIANRYGIPDRAHRRDGKSYRTVVPLAAAAEDLDREKFANTYADFVWLAKAKD
ncbi:MAG: ChaN family lipoprotein [Planctomycetota bacterium]|jgi:uncharacterized iron-regulated protein